MKLGRPRNLKGVIFRAAESWYVHKSLAVKRGSSR